MPPTMNITPRRLSLSCFELQRMARKEPKRRLKKGESRIDAESFILLTLNDHTQRTGSQFSSSPYHLIIITSSDH
jgi:hypothetical protein